MTVSKFTFVLFLFVSLFAANKFVYAQNGVCRVTAYSIDSSIPHSASFSDSTLIREFNLKSDGNFIPGPFQHKESGITVFVTSRDLKAHFLAKNLRHLNWQFIYSKNHQIIVFTAAPQNQFMTSIGEGHQLAAILELTITKVTLSLLLAKKEKHVMINNETPNKSGMKDGVKHRDLLTRQSRD